MHLAAYHSILINSNNPLNFDGEYLNGANKKIDNEKYFINIIYNDGM